MSDDLDLGLDWATAPCRTPDRDAEQAARVRQTRLTKPPGALGRLEGLAIRLAGLQGRAIPGVDPNCILYSVRQSEPSSLILKRRKGSTSPKRLSPDPMC